MPLLQVLPLPFMLGTWVLSVTHHFDMVNINSVPALKKAEPSMHFASIKGFVTPCLSKHLLVNTVSSDLIVAQSLISVKSRKI